MVTGFLADAELERRARLAAVPVAAHRHVSASGSIGSWISAGRRPLVAASRYVDEMARLRPGTMTVYPEGGLAEAIRVALADPASTWLAPGAHAGPDLNDVAASYLGWWRGLR
ncbi:MAG: hypothetical protein H7146_08205 [Burkholderiaceae bacterium]|nr:hypothetical protein [Microbacteriaceae bacterium]